MFVVAFLVVLGSLAAFALFPVIVAVLQGLLSVLVVILMAAVVVLALRALVKRLSA
jgi:hypothetical protein